MYRRNLSLACGTYCILAAVGWSSIASATIVNIDFNGVRNNKTVGLTFSGVGAAGGGSTFNGMIADSRGTPENDLLTVSGYNLMDSYGAATTIGFSITNVGGDHGDTGSDPTDLPAILGDFILSNVTPPQLEAGMEDPVFTFSGLGSATTVDVYFYIGLGSNGGISIGSDLGAYTAIDTNYGTLFFQDVPVTNAQIVGTFGHNFTGSYGAVVAHAPTPEPGTLALLASALFGLLAYAWRKRK